MNAHIEKFVSTPEDRKDFQRGQTLMEVTEMLCRALDEKGVSRAELARRLGTTKGSVSQMLNGDRNLTVRTISDLLFELDLALAADFKPLEVVQYQSDWAKVPMCSTWGKYNEVPQWIIAIDCLAA